jgi:hypothetical protein
MRRQGRFAALFTVHVIMRRHQHSEIQGSSLPATTRSPYLFPVLRAARWPIGQGLCASQDWVSRSAKLDLAWTLA